jgi:ferrous iron transport protein B
MPTVLKVKGYRFFFFSREELRKHIHIQCQSGEAKFWLDPQVELSRNYNLSKKELRAPLKTLDAHNNTDLNLGKANFRRTSKLIQGSSTKHKFKSVLPKGWSLKGSSSAKYFPNLASARLGKSLTKSNPFKDHYERLGFLEVPLSYRKIAIDLISENKETFKLIHNQPIWMGLQPIVLDAINHIKLHHNEEAVVDIFAEEFMAFNKGILTETVKVKHIDEKKLTTTQKIDNILIHPLLGLPIFLFFMWSLFQLTFELGSIPMDYIDAFFGTLGESIGNTIQNDELRSLMVDGIIAGVGAVVMFVPNIMILFIGIALLEGTGYMSRVAYLLDGFFHRFGLHGQSFIPLVTGFGCSIPAYMSARILKNDKDRLITLFIIGFMSCGAKLPVYVLFTGAFFAPEYAGNILFIIYISGALLGLVMAKILKMTAFKGSSEPFVMEMPKYRMPSLTLIGHTVKSKTWMYLKKAGTFIAAASMLVWFLSNYPKNHELESLYATKIEQTSSKQQATLKNELSQKLLEQSYLGIIGKTIEPIFAPLGMDWKMAVALQTGLAAKEVVVSTLGVLYSLGDEVNEENTSLVKRISQNIPFASAVAFIIIVMIYLPCLAATIVFSKEAGGWRYAGYLFVFTSIVAYGLAFIGYLIVS